MKILLLAGEESGDIYARQLRERLKGHDVRGYGDYGFKVEDLAVMGVDEVLRSIFYLLKVKRTIERAIDEWRPDVVCTVDYPGMNMRLAAYAKKRGVRTVHVVCPQVWAWKAGRIPKIQRIFDRLCCFFPFEPALFKSGFAEFVGHPLVDRFRAEEAEGVHATKNEGVTLALLPGSRIGEIRKHLPVMLEAVKDLHEVGMVIPAANAKAHAAIQRLLAEKGARAQLQLGGARELLRRADCAVVASGTATLEAALANCPTVLIYKAAPIFAFIARRVIKGVRFLGLANIIWDRSCAAAGTVPDAADAPMPELLQENLTVGNLQRELLPLVREEGARQRARERLRAAMALMRHDGDAIGRIAEVVQA